MVARKVPVWIQKGWKSAPGRNMINVAPLTALANNLVKGVYNNTGSAHSGAVN